MSRFYTNKQSGLSVVTGTIKQITEDKLTANISYSEWNIAAKKYDNKEVSVSLTEPTELNVGDVVTATGFMQRGKILAETFSKDVYHEEPAVGTQKTATAVLAGEVLFAGVNEEKDAEGNAKLNFAGKPKKPHFDITIPVVIDGEKVNHVVSIYNFPARTVTKEDGTTETKAAVDNISKLVQQFAKFDRVTQPFYVSLITQPPAPEHSEWTKTNMGKNGVEYTNRYVKHMGITGRLDITYLPSKEKEQKKEETKEEVKDETKEVAPATTAPTPVPTQTPSVSEQSPEQEDSMSGFSVGSLDDIEDFTI